MYGKYLQSSAGFVAECIETVISSSSSIRDKHKSNFTFLSTLVLLPIIDFVWKIYYFLTTD